MVRYGALLVLVAVLFVACSPEPEPQARGSAFSEATAVEGTVAGEGAAPAGEPDRPNIVFVVADDLAKRDMRALGRRVNPYTADRGAAFSRAYVASPVCCPSQASILRGQYVHNHKVYNHNLQDGGDAYAPFEPLEGSTLATWLDGAGYETARFGKYLVDWPGDYTPPGWDRFDVWERNTENMAAREGDYVLDSGGSEQTYDPGSGVVPDALLSRRASAWVQENPGRPKFLYFGAHAPHEANVYPGGYADEFSGASYAAPCEENLSDKLAYVRRFARDTCFGSGEEYRERLRAMLTLRDALARIEGAFRAIGELDDTYVVFTSDNGYRLGEHRLPPGKRTPYVEDVEVPLHVRGPGIAPGSTNDALVSLADLAPTAAAWAGTETPPFVDGRDLSPLLADPSAPWRDAVLVEGYSEGFLNARHPAPTYGTVVTGDRSYTRYKTGETELYDLKRDPHQLRNVSGRPAHRGEEEALSRRLQALSGASGAELRGAEVAAP